MGWFSRDIRFSTNGLQNDKTRFNGTLTKKQTTSRPGLVWAEIAASYVQGRSKRSQTALGD